MQSFIFWFSARRDDDKRGGGAQKLSNCTLHILEDEPHWLNYHLGEMRILVVLDADLLPLSTITVDRIHLR
jgi:hypothetical protein